METRMPDSTVQTPEEAELARLMVDTLNLEMNVDAIDPLSPLFGDGLGLDSIDVLELALAISKTYGVQLRADDADNETIFQSLRNLNAYIRQRRSA
jgi:acyl carrier protein